MIYTITFNPSIDYIVEVDDFQLGKVNRTANEYILTGGKGINVSIVLNNLGIESQALGFIAGFTGSYIQSHLEENGIHTDFIDVQNGYSRINFKMKSHEESEVNGNGPMINETDLTKLIEKIKKLNKGDILVLSGSIPKCISDDIYAHIMKEINHLGIKVVVDATGKLLLNSLKYKPFLIKPNTSELSEIFSKEITGVEESLKYAAKLQEMGAKNVLVSMGAKGALLLDEYGKDHYMPALDGKVVNTVGSGDSMVAGFIAGYEKMHDYDYALKLGTASGSATACSEGLADADMINQFMKK